MKSIDLMQMQNHVPVHRGECCDQAIVCARMFKGRCQAQVLQVPES